MAEACKSAVVQEGDESVLRIDCTGCPYGSSLEDSEVCMMRVIYKLLQYKDVVRIQLAEKRIYEYDAQQTAMLKEIAEIIRYIRNMKELRTAQGMVNQQCNRCAPNRFQLVHNLVIDSLPRNPCVAYMEVVRMIRREEIDNERERFDICKKCRTYFLDSVLHPIHSMLENSAMIKMARPYLEGLQADDRSIYRRILHPTVRPNFTFTRLMTEFPPDSEIIYRYKVKDSDVTVLRIKGAVRPFYHVMPPEFKVTEEHFELIDAARQVMARHKPTTAELIDPERVRMSFHDIAFDLIKDFAARKKYSLKPEEMDLLANVLTRETAGLGILEILLSDDKIQDISINAPPGNAPIYIVHQDAEDCQTNVIPTREEVESWAARLRLWSGRPLDQSNPVLDTSVEVPGARARVAAITRSLSPYGLAFSVRRHRESPWTLPLFVRNKMLSPLAAGLLSFIVDGARTMLVAGTRGSGKTSLLGSLMLEIMKKYRVITVEDTLELPVQSLIRLGYNIQSLKVQSAIIQSTTELSAADGIRTSLRLGDSSLIVGEVRSKEALALYEGMRVGAMANVVAGTIHGDSPYGVYDRVVNDLGVPPTSFKATDLILVANPVRSADGLHRFRRVVQVTEIRKHWDKDPVREKGFVDLLEYDAKDDVLKPTPVLTDGESEVISKIAARVKSWVGNFDSVWDNIMLRTKIKQALVEYANVTKNQNIIEADFVVRSNDMFHMISEEVEREIGAATGDVVFERWNQWVRETIREGRV